ncbi:MAG: hypothetical protein JSS43_06865 [Proteobacteria bacterium]|nr:hypothetical protein [Pseudomonadota bacterium]
MQRHELFSAFEGLGNNCEFGFVQDAAGCRGLSLFKNVGFDRTEQLIDALDADFAGMFDDGAFDIVLPSGWPDFVLNCRRYGFRFHTGLASDAAGPEAQVPRIITSFRWLRDKLLQDLRDGEKIFTYRHQIQFNEPLAERLARSIRRHGPGWLLWVRMDDRPDRCFAWVEPSGIDGLLYGGMPHLVTDSPPRVAYDAWEQIAIKAVALRHGQGEALPPPPGPGHVRRFIPGAAQPEQSAVVAPAEPGSLVAVHTWVWLPATFTGNRLDFAALGADLGRGRPVDLELRDRWQPVWVPARVATDRQQIALWLAAPDGSGAVYTSGWTLHRMGANQGLDF